MPPQVTFWAPSAAGAGVTLVMAYLNGNHIPNLLRMRTLITKVVGAMCSVASGLAIGPEGPMVHIGSCIASNITYARCSAILTRLTPWGRCTTDDGAGVSEGGEDDVASVVDSVVDVPRKGAWCATWEELHEDSEHREFIAAGAAAGLSVRSHSMHAHSRSHSEQPIPRDPPACHTRSHRVPCLRGVAGGCESVT